MIDMELPEDSDLVKVLATEFVTSNVIGLFLVGSRSRLHHISSSDVEFMIFYDSDSLIKKTSTFEISGIPAFISHYDKRTYIEATRCYPVNAGALRSLHKLRDGRSLYQTDAISPLQKIATEAHLDSRMVLHYLSRISAEWPALKTAKQIGQANQIITWVEMATILEILSIPGQVAYSKPKWLYYFLNKAGRENVVDLLKTLYNYQFKRINTIKTVVKSIIEELNIKYRDCSASLVDLGVAQDASQMMCYSPIDSLPAVRYLAHHLYRRRFGSYLKDVLKKDIVLAPYTDLIGDTDWARNVISHQPSAQAVLRAISQNLLTSFESGNLPQLHPDVFETLDRDSIISVSSRAKLLQDLNNIKRLSGYEPWNVDVA